MFFIVLHVVFSWVYTSVKFCIVSSKILRKPDTLKTPRDIDKEEWKEIDEDLQVDCRQLNYTFYISSSSQT
jgi:hypothetical protein